MGLRINEEGFRKCATVGPLRRSETISRIQQGQRHAHPLTTAACPEVTSSADRSALEAWGGGGGPCVMWGVHMSCVFFHFFYNWVSEGGGMRSVKARCGNGEGGREEQLW
eukprot:jgi/Botrbrau1/8938/Bobra.0148s0051.1